MKPLWVPAIQDQYCLPMAKYIGAPLTDHCLLNDRGACYGRHDQKTPDPNSGGCNNVQQWQRLGERLRTPDRNTTMAHLPSGSDGRDRDAGNGNSQAACW